MKELLYYVDWAKQKIEDDDDKLTMMGEMEHMWRGEWNLPQQMADLKWIHKVVSTDPHDAIRAGTRVLSSIEPRVNMRPLGMHEDDRKWADDIERSLVWHFHNAGRRRRASILRDIVLSALLYDEVCAQVIYLPHQIDTIKTFKGDTARLEASRRFGDFAVVVRNPKQVHVDYSDIMPERVLFRRVMPLREALDFWGEKAKKLELASKSEDNLNKDYVTIYDYTDLESRVVWAYLQDDTGIYIEPSGDDDAIELMRTKNKLGFLPWVAKVGGTTLIDDPRHQRIPLLYSINQTKQWDTQNALETLLASEVIAYAAAPRLQVEGPTDNVEVDYGEPGRMAYVPPGHKLGEMQPPGFDQSLAVIADRVGERIGKSTVSRVLQSGDFPSGTAFATLNLATQSGIKSLTPYKELAEQALADIFVHMLYWIDYSGDKVTSFVQNYQTKQTEEIVIDPDSFQVDKIYIDVELTPDVPTDRMSRINASSMAVRELGYSQRSGLEDAGATNATEEQEIRRQEKYQETLDNIRLMTMTEDAKAKVAIRNRERQMMSELKMQEEMQRMQQRKQARIESGNDGKVRQALQQREMMNQRKSGQGFAATRGGNFNPAMAGTPPAMANPEGTRETQQSIQGTNTSIVEGV
jgi:hypothetical protein